MKRVELEFARPPALQATAPASARGQARDEARLLVSTPNGHAHARFRDLPDLITPGDLLVVNESATIPASLPASSRLGACLLNLSTHYGDNVWLAEPRWSTSQPGPLPLVAGDRLDVAGIDVRLIAPYPGLPRLWFVHAGSDLNAALALVGRPIRYGYVDEAWELAHYQTVFSRVPGSAEMPSASYPFTALVVAGLQARGVKIAPIVLHTGVSSLEVETDVVEEHPLYPEPFEVSAATAEAVNATIQDGRRVIAVGTTVVRALESAWDGAQVRAVTGFTRLYVHPQRGVHVVDGLITGLHDPVTSHLAMLYAIAGQPCVRGAYAEAVAAGYLWHEFGDSHLILRREAAEARQAESASAVA